MAQEFKELQRIKFTGRERLHDIVSWDETGLHLSIHLRVRDPEHGSEITWSIHGIVKLLVLPPCRATPRSWCDATSEDTLTEVIGVLNDHAVYSSRAGQSSYHDRGRTFVLRHPNFVVIADAQDAVRNDW